VGEDRPSYRALTSENVVESSGKQVTDMGTRMVIRQVREKVTPGTSALFVLTSGSTALRQPSFLRVMLVFAATVVVQVGIRLSAPILDLILSPWSRARCTPGSSVAGYLPRWPW
jgi:hypothetical protein